MSQKVEAAYLFVQLIGRITSIEINDDIKSGKKFFTVVDQTCTKIVT